MSPNKRPLSQHFIGFYLINSTHPSFLKKVDHSLMSTKNSAIAMTVIDQNRFVREKIVFLLSHHSHQQNVITAHFDNFEQSHPFLHDHPCGILLIEAALLDAVTSYQLRLLLKHQPQLKIVLLTASQSLTLPAALSSLDIQYCLEKTIDIPSFLQLIENIIRDISRPTQRDLRGLTSRELEILARLTQGTSNKAIAQAMQISDNTVKVHIQSILTKLKVTNRVEAAVYAYRYLALNP